MQQKWVMEFGTLGVLLRILRWIVLLVFALNPIDCQIWWVGVCVCVWNEALLAYQMIFLLEVSVHHCF